MDRKALNPKSFMDFLNRLPILYRNDGDTRHDTIVKPELLDEYLGQHPDYRVAFILEDRNSMVAKWRELGFKCLQVAEGDF